MNFAELILPVPLPRLFTYSIPDELVSVCTPGKRVIVQFGNKKFYTAIVRRLHADVPENYDTKDIISVLDDEAFLNERHFKFWEWLASYYMCTLGDIFKAALPSGLKLESETRVFLNSASHSEEEEFDGLEVKLNEKEEAVLAKLEKSEGLTLQEINNLLNQKNSIATVKNLIEKKLIFVEEKVVESYRPKLETYIKLNDRLLNENEMKNTFDQLAKSQKQLNLLMSYISLTDFFNRNKRQEQILKKELIEKSGSTAAILATMVKKEIFVQFQKEKSRLEMNENEIFEKKRLNEFQEIAYKDIENQFLTKNVVLLHGVTSSGKTEIYIHLIEKCLKEGKQVLYLLPEIALTSQIINRLKVIFGSKTGVYHSRFSDAERVEIWQNVASSPETFTGDNQGYQLILGVRSSVFLPYKNLGLIIVDEEHENTYKQYDPAPRYNARDAAIVLAQLHGAKVLLGTATPAIETYFNAQTGKFGLVELLQRHSNVELPEIQVVDTYKARKRKQMKSHFSVQMLEGMKLALDNKEQVILFQNRRGFAPFLECKTCQWVPRCRHCDVSLTYHKSVNQLVCHYCNFTMAIPSKCGACGDTAMETKGFGTEKIEDEMAIFFPDAQVARLDMDTTRSKKAYQETISGFEENKINILIGTQMVTKGLDFNNVSVVGIMNADNMLNFPDFRAYERSYQLMAQVSGRAGRREKRGKVIIQTSQPENSVIKDVVKNDYLHLYETQLAERQRFHYPPFFRLIEIGLKCKDQQKVSEAAKLLADELRNVFGPRVFGPQLPLIPRIQNYFIKNILLKIERDKAGAQAKNVIWQAIEKVKTGMNYSSVIFSLDVDPM
jgi:primosomal protein N' (replication factor Y) (superfamily II helicase)